MKPHEAILRCLYRFYDFDGRAGLREFWWFFGFYILFELVWRFFIAGWIILIVFKYPALDQWMGAYADYLYYAGSIAMMAPLAAVSVRRIHDISLSGYFAGPPLAILCGFANSIVITGFNPLLLLISMISLIVFMWPGTPDRNVYGLPAGR